MVSAELSIKLRVWNFLEVCEEKPSCHPTYRYTDFQAVGSSASEVPRPLQFEGAAVRPVLEAVFNTKLQPSLSAASYHLFHVSFV